jgi:peptidoglycan-associated lipoprotein
LQRVLVQHTNRLRLLLTTPSKHFTRNNPIMHGIIRQTGFLVALGALSVGCGSRTQVEEPAPQLEAASSTPTIPYTPVSVEKIPDGLLDDARRATLEQRIYFGFDQSDLSSAARQALGEKAEVLRAAPSLSVRIEGHADERGSDEYNLALSNRRAAAAKRFLVSLGISAERVETVGYGEEQPLDQEESEAAWARNRRDEFRVTSGRLAQQ